MKRLKKLRILLVDDDPGDVRYMKEVFAECGLSSDLLIAASGIEAMDILCRNGIHENTVLPELILLDLNMPGKDGFSVLKDIKSDKRFNYIPVIVLSSSNAKKDILRAYDGNANCYITKPNDLKSYMSVVQSIQNFWANTVRIPKR